MRKKRPGQTDRTDRQTENYIPFPRGIITTINAGDNSNDFIARFRKKITFETMIQTFIVTTTVRYIYTQIISINHHCNDKSAGLTFNTRNSQIAKGTKPQLVFQLSNDSLRADRRASLN